MKEAIFDIAAAQKRWRLIGMLGWQELKHRYRRSLLGPFWLSVSTAFLIFVMSVVFGSVLKMPLAEYVPYVATGMVFWLFISSAVTTSCSAFIGSAALIKQSSVPMFVYVQKDLWRDILTLAHNLLIVPVAFLIVGKGFTWTALLAVPGFLLILANLMWLALVLAVLSTRYRDLPQTVASILPTAMFVTPIIWLPTMMSGRVGATLTAYNPVARLIELVRDPLLGKAPATSTWLICLAGALIGWLVALLLFRRARRRIVYWL